MVLVSLRDFWFGNLRWPLMMLLAAAICLLLIACANSLSLMIARSAQREKDMAIRAALGAGWSRCCASNWRRVYCLEFSAVCSE